MDLKERRKKLKMMLTEIVKDLSEKYSDINFVSYDKGWIIKKESKGSYYDMTGNTNDIFKIEVTDEGLKGNEPLYCELFDTEYKGPFDRHFISYKDQFGFEFDLKVMEDD